MRIRLRYMNQRSKWIYRLVLGFLGVAGITILILSALGTDLFGTMHSASESLVEPAIRLSGEVLSDYPDIYDYTDIEYSTNEPLKESNVNLSNKILYYSHSDINYSIRGALDGYVVFGMTSVDGELYAIEIGPGGNITWAYEFHSNRECELISDVRKLANGNYLVLVETNGIYEINAGGEIVWHYLDDNATVQATPLENGNILVVSKN